MKEKKKGNYLKNNYFDKSVFNNIKYFATAILFIGFIDCKSPDILGQFVDNHLILVESKMKNSPKLWLDIKEGYSRQKVIYYSNLIMDSLDIGLSGYHAVIRHVHVVDSLRRNALSGDRFEYYLKKEKRNNYIKNYFSSSIE